MLRSTTLSSPQVQGQDTAELPSKLLPGGTKGSVAKWRSRNRRIDYAPIPGVLKVITHYLDAGLDKHLVGVIDKLVLAGHRAISGKTDGGTR